MAPDSHLQLAAVPALSDARSPESRLDLVTASHLLLAAAVAVVVGVDGSFAWRCVRVTVVALLTVGAIAAWRTRTRFRVVPTLAHGTVGLVIGAAIGVRHLTKEGVSVRGLGAGIALLAGGILVTAGTRALVHGMSRGRSAIAALVVVVGVAIAFWTAFPAVLVTNVPALDGGPSTPATRGLDYREVRFETGDRVSLAAWYVPSRTGAAVVLRHGSGSTRSAVLRHGEILAAHGYGVLMTDARGHGASSGRAMDFGWFGDQDLQAAVDFLTEQTDVDADRIAVVGLSMGGEEAIGAAGSDPRIRGVVAEGATARVALDKDWYSDVYGLRGQLQEHLESAQYALTDMLTSAPPPTPLRDAVAESEAAFMLIVAGDVPEEQHAAEHMSGAAPDRVTIWTVDGAGHTGGLLRDPDGWTRRVTEFLEDTTGGSR